ncbi:LysR substrate-binding domain-containing protein [uncultured Agrococcus sp.]|uniref:LysR substrate-binding domain-containing protein n=1 Tax=uncultured Agrococcus sp. TaxID=382258 RepID=UPI0025E995D4|nr:LysR substrate-binding domain-containing protein [uncultured Agrococcus sp.]
MELRQLEIFLAVADELHFGRAAETLHMAQPPVSRAVQQLERSLGHPLFERSTRRVTLTSAGEALVAPARAILETADAAGKRVESAALGRSGTVRLAFPGVSTSHRVGQLARAVRREAPDIDLVLAGQHFASGAISALTEGRADLAFVRWDSIPAGIRTTRVFRDRLVVAVPARHPLAKLDTVTMQRLRDEHWVTLPGSVESVLVARLFSLARAAGFEPAVVQEAPDTATAVALVTAELGISLTLQSVANTMASQHVRYVPLADEAPSVDLLMAWHTPERNPALSTVLEIAAKTFSGTENDELTAAQ